MTKTIKEKTARQGSLAVEKDTDLTAIDKEELDWTTNHQGLLSVLTKATEKRTVRQWSLAVAAAERTLAIRRSAGVVARHVDPLISCGPSSPEDARDFDINDLLAGF